MRHYTKMRLKDWGSTGLEIGKWALVIWLLWPLAELEKMSFQPVRLLLGICLFVIFAGKVMYDVVIMDFIRQKRTSVKQDVMTLLGIVVGITLIVGLVVMIVARFLGMWMESTNQMPTG